MFNKIVNINKTESSFFMIIYKNSVSVVKFLFHFLLINSETMRQIIQKKVCIYFYISVVQVSVLTSYKTRFKPPYSTEMDVPSKDYDNVFQSFHWLMDSTD